jgi:hypothetical protein
VNSSARAFFLPLVFVGVVVAACSNTGNSGPSATSSASPSASPLNVYGTTNANPQNCVRQTEDFRYYDTITGQPMPFVENYTPYPLGISQVHYYLATPTPPPAGQTPVAVELPFGANPPKGTKAYAANPVVPVIAWTVVFGLHDNGTVLIIPSGQISNDYQKDLIYRGTLEQEAESFTYSTQQGGNPTPMPSNAAGAAFDQQFQALGMPAMNAVSRGANPDDRFYKGYTTPGGTPVESADPHPRIAACNWLQDRPYDLILTVIKKRQLPPDQYNALATEFAQQQAPSGLIDTAGWVAYERDVYVASGIMPELWLPSYAQTFQDSYVLFRSQAYPAKEILSVPLPATDDTTNGSGS